MLEMLDNSTLILNTVGHHKKRRASTPFWWTPSRVASFAPKSDPDPCLPAGRRLRRRIKPSSRRAGIQEEVQDHRVLDRSCRGKLVDSIVRKHILLTTLLREAIVGRGLTDKAPTSRLGAPQKFIITGPTLRQEQPLVNLATQIKGRDTRIVFQDVLAAHLGGHSANICHDLLGDNFGFLALRLCQLTEVTFELRDTEEIVTHKFTGSPLRHSLLIVESQLFLDLFDEPLTKLDIVDGLLIKLVGHASSAQSAHEFSLTSHHLIGVATHFDSLTSTSFPRVAILSVSWEYIQKRFG
jgi:hypothetical protein